MGVESRQVFESVPSRQGLLVNDTNGDFRTEYGSAPCRALLIKRLV